MVSFTPRQLYPQVKSPCYPLDRRLGGPQSRSGRDGKVIHFVAVVSRRKVFAVLKHHSMTARDGMKVELHAFLIIRSLYSFTFRLLLRCDGSLLRRCDEERLEKVAPAENRTPV
jgi:hypothetical protein